MVDCPNCDDRLRYSFLEEAWTCESCGFLVFEWQPQCWELLDSKNEEDSIVVSGEV